MMSIALRRSYSVAPRQTLAAIDTLLRHNQYSCPTTSSTNLEVPGNGCSGCEIRSFSTFRASKPDMPFGFQARGFHAKPSPLNYQASVVLQAEFAVDECSSYGDSSKGSADDEGLEIAKLGISQEIVSSLSKKGISKLFPIQKAVLDPAMKGRDMIGRARTGTGKTLAFGIPILDKIIRFNAKHGRGRNPMALVLAPTRELAKQVEKEFCDSAPSLDTICCYGGTPISNQMRQLNYGVDITVGTPGRIIDLLNRGALNLSEVQFLVLDEADQMLQVGFQENVETILQNLPPRRQTLMFSATMPPWIRKITESYLHNPLMIDLVGDSDQKLADGISLYSIASETYGKASILGPLITEHAKGGKCIVFTQTKRDADRLAYVMAKKYKCEALHGDISQDQRERTLAGFRSGHFNILVATDVASRGLDIPNVDLVIHYELPGNSEIFVHRSGRTGRAGKKGSCILMYTEDQNHFVRGIERDVGCKFTELPRIAGEEGDSSILGLMSGGRFGSSNRYGSQGGGGFGRSSGYGYSGQMGRSGGPGRSSGFGDFGSSRSSGFGDFGSSRSSGFGSNDGDAGQSSGFGDFGSSRSSKFGNFGSSRSSGFGSNDGDAGQSSGFGDFGSSRSSKFGNFGSSRSSGFGSNDGDASSSGRFGSFGDFGSSRPSGLGGSSSGQSSGGFGDFRSKIGEVLTRDLNGK